MGYFLLQNFLDRRILRRQEFRPILHCDKNPETGKAGNVPGKQQSGEKRVGEKGNRTGGIKKRKHADIKGKKQGKKSESLLMRILMYRMQNRMQED